MSARSPRKEAAMILANAYSVLTSTASKTADYKLKAKGKITAKKVLYKRVKILETSSSCTPTMTNNSKKEMKLGAEVTNFFPLKLVTLSCNKLACFSM
jgi:hypothetical protein